MAVDKIDWQLLFLGINRRSLAGQFRFRSIYNILMNSANFGLSEGCIRELYALNRCETKQPTLQIIDFEQSQLNDKEITIRLSDGLHFVDCTLSGNYQITNDCICQTKITTSVTNFKRFHIVRLIDYFSKLDETRICKLKIIVRKMNQMVLGTDIIGVPQQIQQFMINNRKFSLKPQLRQNTVKKNPKKEHECKSNKTEDTYVKVENVMDLQTNNNYVYYSQPNNSFAQNFPQINQSLPPPPSLNSQTIKTTKKELPITSTDVQSPGLGQPLTLQEIMNGRQGFLIGRLIRYKHSRRQTKDGPMTVCYLGVLDKHNELIRIHLAGRLAMSNEKSLKLNKCYYIRGFDLVPVKGAGLQIRLKDKEYKILQIHNQDYTRVLNCEYFHWDHQSQIQNEFIDVIGMVDDIQQKTNYNPNNLIDKSVIRVVVRNKYKSIRISFWTDQMKNLESFKLKRKELIIIEDVRKKQSKYYDFGNQSNLIRLSDFPLLMEKYKDIFPELVEQPEPQNIKQLSNLYDKDPNNSKLRIINAFFTHCKENKIVYRLCQECKKKVQKNATECHQCGSQNLVFKYNCPLEFSDSTGSIIAILFDAVAYKLIGKTANQVSQYSEKDLEQLFEPLYYRPYLLTIQNRNQRLIMKAVDPLPESQQADQAKMNIQKIKESIYPSQLWPPTFKI